MTIAEFEQSMEALIGTGDPESAHGEADDLLAEAIEALGGQSWRRFLDLYAEVEKWYA